MTGPPTLLQRLHARALAATLVHAHRDRMKAAHVVLVATTAALPWAARRAPWPLLALWAATILCVGLRSATRRPYEGSRRRHDAAKRRIRSHPLRLLVIAQLAARPGPGDRDVSLRAGAVADYRRIEEGWLVAVGRGPLRQTPVELHRIACALRDDHLAASLLGHATRSRSDPWISGCAAVAAATQLRAAGAEDVARALLEVPGPPPLEEVVDAAVAVAAIG